MAKKMSKKEVALNEVQAHYTSWTEDMEQRLHRNGGWNDITDAYWGKLPEDWPYLSKVVDPRIRTSLIEKNSRLLNSRLRGRTVPRGKDADQIKATVNNALLDFQWDTATYGGSMLTKWASMDMDTRLYGSRFAFVGWKYVKDDSGAVLFDGNEFEPIDVRDSGIDPNCRHIRDANWFQHRQWRTIESLENENDLPDGKTKYPGLKDLKDAINYEMQYGKASHTQDLRENAYQSRVKQIKSLEDRMGRDSSFPVQEIVTEYRKDRWITFSPTHSIVLRDIPNPYRHQQIPIVQLRYYPLGDDPIGESEVEPVLPIWRAIQATVCGYLDNMNIHMRPPLKVLENAVRIETIEYGPEAQWMMDRLDAVAEHTTNGEAMRYFQTTYGALVSAFNTAMGDLSQGISNVDMFGSGEKTATEIRQVVRQQTMRDQNNQMYLAEAIQDMMRMWISNNQQFIFSDPERQEYILRVVGREAFEAFKRMGLDEMVPLEGSEQTVADIITQAGGQIDPAQVNEMFEATKVPKYPVIENPDDDPLEMIMKPKLRVADNQQEAEVSIIPEDLMGEFDYIPDVKSMAAGASAEQSMGRQQLLQLMTGNPLVLQLLAQNGQQPNIYEVLVDVARDSGVPDPDRYFSSPDNGQPILPPAAQEALQGAQAGGAQGFAGQLAPQPNANQGNMAGVTTPARGGALGGLQ